MIAALMRFATPFVTALFAISTLSGVALFFHIQPGWFHIMHEWLSMVLLVPVGFHVARNWRPLLAYLQRGQILWPSAVTAVAAIAIALPAILHPAGRPDPIAPLASAIESHSLVETAAFVGRPSADLQAVLVKGGFSIPSDAASLRDIASASGRSSREVVAAIVTGLKR